MKESSQNLPALTAVILLAVGVNCQRGARNPEYDRIVRELQTVGAEVRFDDEREPIAVLLRGDRIGRHEIELVSSLSTLVGLDLHNCSGVDNEAIKSIRKLERLEQLELSGTGISDQGVDVISGMRRLRVVYLGETSVSTERMQRLRTELPSTTVVGAIE